MKIFQPNDWFLHRVEAEYIGNQRCKVICQVYDRNREAVVTVVQEAYSLIVDKKEAKI